MADPPPTARPFAKGRRRGVMPVWIGLCVVALAILLPRANWDRIRAHNTNLDLAAELGQVGYVFHETLRQGGLLLAKRRLVSLEVEPFRDFLQGQQDHRATVQPAPTRPRFIVFVQLESIDGFSLEAEFRGAPLMPFLRSLIGSSLYFPRTIDNTGAGRTTDGELLALASILPVPTEPAFVHHHLGDLPSLPRILAREGYGTVSMHGNEGTFWNRAVAHRQIGFEHSFFRPDLDASDILGWGISDASILAQAAEKIVAANDPLFLHVILLSHHHPFGYVGRKQGHLRSSLAANCADSLRYVDRSIADFFDRLRSANVLDDCLIAIYSDHGSGVGTELRKSFLPPDETASARTVPLLLIGSSRPPARVERPAGLQDLPVMVLQELGVPIPLTFVGSGHPQSSGVTLVQRGLFAWNDREAARQEPPVDLRTLTELSILFPERLVGGPDGP